MSMLQQLYGEQVLVQSKWGPMYSGVLVSADSFMNLQIKDCVEISGETEGDLGETLFRCNNVLHIRKAPVK